MMMRRRRDGGGEDGGGVWSIHYVCVRQKLSFIGVAGTVSFLWRVNKKASSLYRVFGTAFRGGGTGEKKGAEGWCFAAGEGGTQQKVDSNKANTIL